MKVFAFATAVGICVLVPVNYFGSQLDIDFSVLPQKSIDSFSISNVNDGSKWYVDNKSDIANYYHTTF